MMALTNGELETADGIFEECLDRADQIDVNELRARSYEGRMRVAEKKGDQGGALKWLEKAQEARRAA